MRASGAAQSALKGVNAAVVGLLLAALYTPVWTNAIFAPPDFGLAVLAFLALEVWRARPGWWSYWGRSARQRWRGWGESSTSGFILLASHVRIKADAAETRDTTDFKARIKPTTSDGGDPANSQRSER